MALRSNSARFRLELVALLPALLLAACNSGSVPTNGKLPGLDGSSLTNVSAANVGSLAATDVVTGISTVNAASDKNAAATLVKRDSAGNFSAGTITANLVGSATTAGYALGQLGPDLTAATSLAVGTGGNVFRVSGNNSISAINPLSPGATITLLFKDTPTLVHSASSLNLSGHGNYTPSSGDLFQFVFLGGTLWQEVFRSTQADSHLEVSGWQAQSIPNLDFDYTNPLKPVPQTVKDFQGEYLASTGVFTAHQDGVYEVQAGFITDTLVTGGQCYLTVRHGNPLTGYTGITSAGYNTPNCVVAVAGTLALKAGDTVAPFGHSNPAVFILANGGIDFFLVTRRH